MNLVELILVADVCRGGGTRIGGEYVIKVDSDRCDGRYVVVVYGSGDVSGVVVVYGSSDVSGLVVLYGNDEDGAICQRSKL